MEVALNISTLELLASRICHDLISPISAINNGLELAEELGPDSGDEIKELIAHAAKQASKKLQLMRFAYGAGGNDPSIRPAQVFDAFSGFLEGDNKITFIPPDMNGQQNLMGTPAINRIMACVLFLAHECLPRGGEISLTCEEPGKALFTLSPAEEKLWVMCKAKMAQSIECTGEYELDPKSIHPHVTGLFLKHYGYEFELSGIIEGKATITLTLPAKED